MSVKVFEAREHCKAAEKFLKTSLIRWKPDYDSAADEYSQAAQCYRIARDMPNSKECHLKAAECFKKNNALFHSAKALESAMIVCKEIATPQEIHDLAMEASVLYQQHGSGDAGATVLEKAGKILIAESPELACKVYQTAAEVSSATLLKNITTKLVAVRIVPLEYEVARSVKPKVPDGKVEPEQMITRKNSQKQVSTTKDRRANPKKNRNPLKTVRFQPTPPLVRVLRKQRRLKAWRSQIRDEDFYYYSNAGDLVCRTCARTFICKSGYISHLRAHALKTESSQHQGSEYIGKASRLLVKLQRYDEAVDSIRREIGFHQESGNTGSIGRLTVAIVLVQLARGDNVAAEKAYKEWGSNCEVAEMQTLEQILQAYDEEDRESAKRALASPFIRNMDIEYARLAATVPLPEAMEPAPRAAVRENAAPSYVSPNAQSTTTADVSGVSLEESPYATVTYPKKSDDEDGLC